MQVDEEGGTDAPIERLTKPLRLFAAHKLAGAGLLVAATVVALIWANSPHGDAYRAILDTKLTFGLGGFSLSKPLHLWINDGLMGVFFFVVGLEIKREFLSGELSSPRKAVLPIVAAIGGMVVPAGIYFALNAGGPGASGWAIAMATDIAFCLGMLALLGDRAPSSLKIFLTALAIVDDIGAIVVIALFYTAEISMLSLGAGAVILAVSIAANVLGVRNSIFYFILGTLTWLAFLKSGVHATLAAVLMAFTIPAKTRLAPGAFADRVNALLDSFRSDDDESGQKARFLTYEQHHALDALNESVKEVLPPVQKLEHALMPLVTFIVLPIFALANAGVRIEPAVLDELGSPVALGIIAGLFVGKQVGVFGFSWVAIKTGIANLPDDLRLMHLYGGAILAGIGFTMSLFIGGLAFQDPLLGELSKMSILIASIAAAAWGYIVIRFIASDPPEDASPPVTRAEHE